MFPVSAKKIEDMDSYKRKIKLLVTGGHHTPAFAVLDELRRKFSIFNFQFSIIWLGHKFSMAGDRNQSLSTRKSPVEALSSSI